jgi:hypothetical protein
VTRWPLALLLVGGLVLACRHGAPPSTSAPASSPSPLHLDPLTDLLPAARLAWLLDARPRTLLSNPAILSSIEVVLPDTALDAFARSHGGVDLRACDELVVAGYDASTLFLAHEVVDPAKVEAAWSAEAAAVVGRAIDVPSDDPRGVITRVWGSLGTGHESLVLFGREAVGVVHANEGPLRAAELFAQGKLKRTLPALRTPPLDRVAERLSDAPVRLFAAGPFEGEWASGLSGLLAVATGAGVSANLDPQGVTIVAVLLGPWGERTEDAKGRVVKAYEVFADSGLGRLLGFHEPIVAPRFTADGDCVRAEVRIRLEMLARGLADASSGSIGEVMKRVR